MSLVNTLRTTIDGKDYKLHLTTIAGQPSYYVRGVRKQADGTEVDAFLSNRQWKAENRVKSRFAKEIKEHMAAR